MGKIFLRAYPIYSTEELEKIDENTKFTEWNFDAMDKGLSDLWNEKQNLLMPGMNESHIIALRLNIELIKQNVDAGKVAISVRNIIREIFGEENVFSTREYDEESILISYLIYPLDGRVLNISKWIDGKRIKKNYYDKILNYISNNFELNIAESEIKSENTNEGYSTELLAYKDHLPYRSDEDDKELIYDTLEKDNQIQTDMPLDRLIEISNETIIYFTVGVEEMLFENAQMGKVTEKDFMQKVTEYLKRMHSDISNNDIEIIHNKVRSAVFGNYVLDSLIDDMSISDIKVISPDKIRVKINGKRKTSNLHFINLDDYWRFIKGLAIRNHLDLRDDAINVFTDKYSNENFIMRMNITTNQINSVPYPYLHTRKIRKTKYSIKELIQYEMMDETIANYLIDKAKNAKGIIFTGKGASGKTSLMNTLLDYISFNNSGLVIQESEELFSNIHPDLMFQHVTEQYKLQDLARNGLLTDLDYFIIGEVKGAEAKYFINAADTGHKCWCSVHSPNSLGAIDKLADYVMYESRYDKTDCMYMLKELEIIVFMKNFKVYEISEIAGWDYEKKCLIYKSIYRREE